VFNGYHRSPTAVWCPKGSCKTTQEPHTKKGTKKGREPTIVIVVFHIMTIVGESSQNKVNKNGKTFSSRRRFHLVTISKNAKSIYQKTKTGESWAKDKNCCGYVEKDENI
jgi:hypothetical protein